MTSNTELKIDITSNRDRFRGDRLYVYPQFGSDLWIYFFHNNSIFSVREKEYITQFSDDRGLFSRLKEIFPIDIRVTLMAQGLNGVTFSCPQNIKQFYNTPIANRLTLYDGIGDHSFLDGATFRAKMFTYLDKKYHDHILIPNVCLTHKLDELFTEDSILQTASGYLGFVARKTDNTLIYLFEDPFATVHEPKYLSNLEITEISPSCERIEDLIDLTLRTVNWELVKTQIPHFESGKYKWITSIMMDQFYFDILYYSLSKRLWLEEEISDDVLQGVEEEPLLVDFVEIKRRLRAAIREKIGMEELEPILLSEDTSVIEEDEDFSWVLKGE